MSVDLNSLRERILKGESYTRDELRAAVEALRTKRVEAATKTQSKRAANAPMTDEALDESLKSLGLDL